MVKWYKNLKVKSKLLFSFSFMMFLVIIVGAVSIVSIVHLRNANQAMYAENTVPLGDLALMYDSFANQQISLQNMALFKGTSANILKDEEANLKEKESLFEDAFNNYEKSITTDEDRIIFEKIQTKYFEEFAEAKSEVLNAINSGDSSKITNSMSKMASLASEISTIIDEAFEYNEILAKNKVDNNTRAAVVSIIILSLVILIAFAITIISALFIAYVISGPIKRIMSVTKQVSEEGNLDFAEEIKVGLRADALIKDEIGQTASYFSQMMDHLIESSVALDTVATGDLSIEVSKQGPNDTLGNALEQMISNLNKMFYEVNSVTDMVSSGAHQIADGANEISIGASSQASSIAELSATIAEVNNQTQKSVKRAQETLEFMNQARLEVQDAIECMQELKKRMSGISTSSSEISAVIKVIDDIAFQTNILSLNAAVEAARAGQQGKGFAVVADEVRNLASKSSEAAKVSANLIQTSVAHVQNGETIVGKTNESVEKLAETARMTQEKINEINEAFIQQQASISQINDGINQIFEVVQSNSATSEQSAAASEEFSEQSRVLKQLVERFNLKNS